MSDRLLEYLYRYLDFCTEMFKYDIEVFSKPWIYWILLIPAIFYFIFFCIKWMVITMPIWLPFRMIFLTFKTQILKHKKIEE